MAMYILKYWIKYILFPFALNLSIKQCSKLVASTLGMKSKCTSITIQLFIWKVCGQIETSSNMNWGHWSGGDLKHCWHQMSCNIHFDPFHRNIVVSAGHMISAWLSQSPPPWIPRGEKVITIIASPWHGAEHPELREEDHWKDDVSKLVKKDWFVWSSTMVNCVRPIPYPASENEYILYQLEQISM